LSVVHNALDPTRDAGTGQPPEAMNVQSIEVCNLQLREPGYGIVRDNHLDWIVHLGRHEVHTMKALGDWGIEG
jgi:hypothetical protein